MYRLAVNVGLGGIRIYSDEPFKPDSKLELDLLLPNRNSVRCIAQVIWVRELENHQPAKYDVGLEFLSVPPRAVEALESVLEPEE